MPWWPVPKASAASISMRDVVGLAPRAVVRAMDQEAPGAHGGEALQRGVDPVLLRHAAERDLLRQLLADRAGDEGADIVLVGRIAEIDFHHPGRRRPAGGRGVFLEGGGGGFGGIEGLDHEIGDGARRGLVACQPHHVGGVVGGQAFEHGGALAWGRGRS